MSARAAAWLAWSLWTLAMVSIAISVALVVMSWSARGAGDEVLTALVGIGITAAISVGLAAFATVGALVASRLPHNPIGWIFCFIGLGLGNLASAYSDYALARPGSLPGGEIAAWAYYWLGLSFFPLFAFVLLLFPTGGLPSRRWRPFAWLAGGVSVVIILLVMFMPGPLPGMPSVRNPFGIQALGGFRGSIGSSYVAFFVVPILLVSAASLMLRFRRARGEERQQLKWLATAAALMGIILALSPLVFWLFPGSEELWGLFIFVAWAAFPISVGVAILRYRLYDLNVIVRATLVYGTLTVTLALVYVGSVVLLRGLLFGFTGRSSQLTIVASTLAVAALFNPLRRRIQGLIDRRFYRRKYDARKTLETFSAKLRDETDLEALNNELVGVVSETMQPTHVSLWLRPSNEVGEGRRQERSR
ncbi:MAG TPA: hypothetical protein VGW38_19710 [Chloroflexota bacterium]|nr:hypothetical protein [Chloroflexota bacterium]